MKYFILIVGIILTVIGLVLIFKKEEVKSITNLERLHYSYSTSTMMNGYVSYDLDCKKECILKYKPDLEPEENSKDYKIDNKDIKLLEDKLTELNISSWDGFDKSDKNVMDGNSFSFSLKCKDGTRVEAHGYMKYPKDYSKVTSELVTIFSKYIKEKNND